MTDPVRSSYLGMIEYVKAYSMDQIDIEDELTPYLKSFHKNLFALLCWHAEINKHEPMKESSMWFNECVSDLVQMILLVSQGFYKPSNLLHRSAIENFIKFFLISNSVSLDSITTVYQLFEKAKETAKFTYDEEFVDRIILLNQIYSQLCNYVHTSGEEFCTFAKALSEYPCFVEDKLKTSVSQVISTIGLLNVSMCFILPDVLPSMGYKNKDSILDIIPPTMKRKLA